MVRQSKEADDRSQSVNFYMKPNSEAFNSAINEKHRDEKLALVKLQRF